ncbi:MAG: GNAT family N-acetyltransferase [Rubrivivax sp.]
MTPQLVRLEPSMLDDLMALSSSAHWNQNEADWRSMLEWGQGWGLQVQGETGRPHLAASTLVLPYERRFAWVSMVLVLPAWRRQGLARALLSVALDHLRRQGLSVILDATPAGHPVYAAQGFKDAWGFTRWRLPGPLATPSARAQDPGVRPLQPRDWPAVATLDAKAFGADRMPLLQRLSGRLPQAAWVLHRSGELRGFVLGRDGRTAWQLGPLVVASREATASSLDARSLLEAAAASGAATDAAAASLPGTGPRKALVVDVRDGQPLLQDWLAGQGFAPERPFTRMVLRPQGLQAGCGPADTVHTPPREELAAPAPGDRSLISLVAGPELG